VGAEKTGSVVQNQYFHGIFLVDGESMLALPCGSRYLSHQEGAENMVLNWYVPAAVTKAVAVIVALHVVLGIINPPALAGLRRSQRSRTLKTLRASYSESSSVVIGLFHSLSLVVR
jgi:uncharacterized membrane protein